MSLEEIWQQYRARLKALLEAKNAPYEIEFIMLNDKPKRFLDISPTGQVPVLVTERGTTLFESDAIVEYIDEITAPLVANVSVEQRAIERAWSYQATKHYLVQCSTMQSTDKETLGERSAKLNKAFEKAEKKLGDGPFFWWVVFGKRGHRLASPAAPGQNHRRPVWL